SGTAVRPVGIIRPLDGDVVVEAKEDLFVGDDMGAKDEPSRASGSLLLSQAALRADNNLYVGSAGKLAVIRNGELQATKGYVNGSAYVLGMANRPKGAAKDFLQPRSIDWLKDHFIDLFRDVDRTASSKLAPERQLTVGANKVVAGRGATLDVS